MKTNLTLLLLIIVMVFCQLEKNDNTETVIAEATGIDNTEDYTTDTVKATATLWIDEVETKHCKGYGFRTIEVKVLICEGGKVNLLSFVKKQPLAVKTYMRRHLFKFQVSERVSEGEYVQFRKQFVQLCCLWGMLKGK